jgi:transposase
VGVLTALVFLTELGDVKRFKNRGQLGSYLGLTPSSHESGKASDRKGHITRTGPSRIRKVLCQAVWSQIRWDEGLRAIYRRICEKNPKRNKVGVVALMRRLGIRLWHRACEALAA